MKSACIICNTNKIVNLFKKNNYQLVKCRNCSFVFVHPKPGISVLTNLYKNFTYIDGFVNENSIRKDAQRTLQNLARLGYSHGRLIDIGCGAGFFLDEARRYGWDVYGIDTSQRLIDYAKNRLRLKVVAGDINTYRFHNSFKVITLIQLIEHLIDPISVLQRVYDLLQYRGLIYITTPNINSYLAKILKKDFNYIMPPEHLTYWSHNTLADVIDKAGFKVIRTATYGYSSDLAGIIKQLIRGKKLNKYCRRREKVDTRDNSRIKKVKSLLFDELFCRLFYGILNYNYGGSIIEVYAEKR